MVMIKIRAMCCIATGAILVGCVAVPINPRQPTSESLTLSNVMQLTSGFARAGDARFSPDMRWIVFQASVPQESTEQLFAAPLRREGTEIVGIGRPVRISPVGSVNSGASIADGNTLVLGSTGTSAKASGSKVGLHRADGWEPAVTAGDFGSIIDLARHRISPADAVDAQPSFSRDGKRIAFANQDGDQIDLFVANADGTNRVRVTSGSGFEGFPVFSPDGKRLAYCAAEVGSRVLDVYVCQLTFDGDGVVTGGTRQTRLSENADVQRAPTWTATGRHIVYSSEWVGQSGYRLRAMRADGTLKTQVTFDGLADTSPALSPDGRYLLWTAKRSPDGTPQVFLAKFTLPAGL